MVTVYGNLQGLKASYIKQLEHLYEERLPSSQFVTSEFAKQIAALSQDVEFFEELLELLQIHLCQ
jgi:GTPase